MSFSLTATDRARLAGIHPDLVKVVEAAAKATSIPFTVMEGKRSLAQQKKNIAKGVSWTLKSRHLSGHAVDLVPLVGGKITWAWPVYYKLAPIIKAAAASVGVPVEWGGDWSRNKDGPHWQLPWKKYPA